MFKRFIKSATKQLLDFIFYAAMGLVIWENIVPLVPISLLQSTFVFFTLIGLYKLTNTTVKLKLIKQSKFAK
jgi:hypothetical protein